MIGLLATVKGWRA